MYYTVLSVLQEGRISTATLPLRLFQWLVMPRSSSIQTSSEMLPHWPFPSANMDLKAVATMERKWQPMTSRRWLTTGVVGMFGWWSAHLHSEWGLIRAMLTKWYEWDVLQVSKNLCRSLAVLEEMGVNVRGQSSFMRVISKRQHFGANQSNPLNDSQRSCRSSRAAGSELQPHTVCSIRWFYMYTPGCSVGLYSLILLGSAVARRFLSILKRAQQMCWQQACVVMCANMMG